MTAPQAEVSMVRLAKQRGAIWYQLDCGKEVIATLVHWRDHKARIEFVSGYRRNVPTDRIRPHI